MRQDLIKNILNEKKKKKKKRKKMKPIGQLYSISPVFADATLGVPEGMEEGLNLVKMTKPEFYYFDIHICHDQTYFDPDFCGRGSYSIFVKIPSNELDWWVSDDSGELMNREDAAGIIDWTWGNELFSDEGDELDIDYVTEITKEEYDVVMNEPNNEAELDEGLNLVKNKSPNVYLWALMQIEKLQDHFIHMVGDFEWNSEMESGIMVSLYEGEYRVDVDWEPYHQSCSNCSCFKLRLMYVPETEEIGGVLDQIPEQVYNEELIVSNDEINFNTPFSHIYDEMENIVNSWIGDPDAGNEAELDEEGGLSDTLGANDLPQVPKWESGMTRGHANPIDFSKPWESGISRGHANSLFEGLNLQKQDIRISGDYPNGSWTKKIYDDRGNEIEVETNGGYWEKNKYDDKGNLIYHKRSNGYWEKHEYDETGRSIYNVNSNGNIEKYLGNNSYQRSYIGEGLNLVKKEHPPIFKYLDETISRIEREHEPNMGKNVFRLYTDSGYAGGVFKVLVYPSGKVSILQYSLRFVWLIEDIFKISYEDFKTYFEAWFKANEDVKYQIISEGLNLIKKTTNPILKIDDKMKLINSPTMPYLIGHIGTIMCEPDVQETWGRISYTVRFPGFIDTEIVWSDEDVFIKVDQHDANNLQEGLNLVKKPQGLKMFPDEWAGEILSDGTLNPKHLIPKYLYYLSKYQWVPEWQMSIDKLSGEWIEIQNQLEENPDGDDFYEQIQWIGGELDEVMSGLAPKATYFGSSEGDGALIGFWKRGNDEDEITPEDALGYLRDGIEVMVLPYDDDYESYTGITIEDFEGETDEEILEYLREKDSIQLW